MKTCRREVEVVIISDVHLGTYGCKAKQLYQYLKGIKPKTLVLNGDIVDIWQFSKRYWPKAHMKVIRQIIGFVVEGTEVIYITGNHDEMMRKFAGSAMGNFSIVNQTELKLGDKKAWVFHGDVFDMTVRHSRWIAKMGANGYGLLILLNRFCNYVLGLFGRGPYSFSKRIKDGVKKAGKAKQGFIRTAAESALAQQYDYVICGHLHHPEVLDCELDGNTVTYLNSGDWVENMSSLEHNDGEWQIYRYGESVPVSEAAEDVQEEDLTDRQLYFTLLQEFSVLHV